MTTPFTIRKLTPADAEAWAVLRREALEKHPFAFSASLPEESRYLVESIEPSLTKKESAVFGAFQEGSLIGIVGVVRKEGLKERHKALIWGMYVAASSRGGGVGNALMRVSIEEATSWSGVQLVHLAVNETAPEAQRLYERLGFRAWGREPHAICWDGRCTDEIHMVLSLPENS